MRTSDLTHISKLKTTRSELFANYRNNDAFNEDEGDAAEVNWRDGMQRFFYQDYGDIEALIQNLTIMAALVSTLCVTMVTIIELPEFPDGNAKVLAMHHRGFRCHFAPEITLDVCRGTIDCSKGYGPEDYDMNEARLIANQACGGGSTKECNPENMAVGYDLLRDLSLDDVNQWIEKNYYEFPKYSFPSKAITRNGFFAVLCLMTSLFVSVCLYVSLVFSHARDDPKELVRWWLPIGALAIFGSYLMLLLGAYYFFAALEGVIAVRFPFYEEYGCFVTWNVNFTNSTTAILFFLIAHHLHTRLPTIASSSRRKIKRVFQSCSGYVYSGEAHHDEQDEDAEKKKSKTPKIRPFLRNLIASSSEDLSHIVPFFEQSRITPSQMENLEKDDLLSMGLCLGDALRTLELLRSKKDRRASKVVPRLSRLTSQAQALRGKTFSKSDTTAEAGDKSPTVLRAAAAFKKGSSLPPVLESPLDETAVSSSPVSTPTSPSSGNSTVKKGAMLQALFQPQDKTGNAKKGPLEDKKEGGEGLELHDIYRSTTDAVPPPPRYMQEHLGNNGSL